jgi:uncharacterized protein YqgQ
VVKEQGGVDSLPYVNEMGALGANLLQQKKWIEAESILRESLALFEKKEPDEWTVHSTQSLLGNALLEQKRYLEAESLLIKGYGGLKTHQGKLPQPARHRVADAGERIVRLYAIWGRPDKATEWQTKLASPGTAESKP